MKRSASTHLSCAVALLAAAGGLGGCIQTSTYGTGESPEMAIFREVSGGFGLFGGGPKQEPIDYEPRAPLVMPPTAEAEALPPPIEPAATADAAWPQDPDQTARGKDLAETSDDTPVDQISSAEARRLKPFAGLGSKDWQVTDPEKENPVYDLIDSKKEQAEFQAALNEAKGYRKERRYLTDPPDAYKEPAPTAPAEFEDIKDESEGNFLTRLFTGAMF